MLFRLSKTYGPIIRFFVTTPHFISPLLVMATRLCSSGRSVPQFLTFCSLGTPFVRRIPLSEKTIFYKYPEYPFGCKELCPSNSCRVSLFSSTKSWRFCGSYGNGNRQSGKMRCTIERESSTMNAALQILRAGSLCKSSLSCSTFSWPVPGRPYPPLWPRFPVSKCDCAHLWTRKRC